MIEHKDLEVYKAAMDIGDIVWTIVARWTYLKRTLGKQFTRAADSIAFNINEGYGRFHYAENRNFCYYRRGSAFETSTAIIKAKTRNLITGEETNNLKEKLTLYFRLINPYIKSIGKTLDSMNSNDSIPK